MEPPTSVPRYVYRPLENLTTIRVLALHTAPVFGAPLKADIVHIDRKGLLLPASPNEYDIDAHEDAPACRSYEAVSYCWGEATFTHRLWCENDWSYLMITPNLDVMLRRLRRPHKIRYLWIDAICLNQSDDLEKSEQVQLMGKIYEHARKVIFWMGEPDGEPIQALYDYIHSIVRTDQADLKHLHARFSEKYPGALYNYLHRPWFWRRWIIQEAILAADAPVLCGGLKINWRVFLDVVRENLPEMITTGVSSPDQPTQSMPAQEVKAVIAHISALSGRVYYMLDLLTTFHRSACSDPRDRLFALRGIALDVYDGIDFLRPSGDISFAVDYSKPWGVVYTDFARACVEAGHGRHILNK
ncbi:HET-domain-containing protein, partial [Lophiostoma macrostomum CBS 122681]